MSPLHPAFVVMTALAIGASLLGLYENHPELIPWIFAASALGMVVRAWMLEREDNGSSGQGKVDHAFLHNLDFGPYGPWLKENVRGQDAAVDVVAQTISRGLKLSQPNRSVASFLLVGPTGTGKTFLSLMTAKALWPEREPVILRMNQFKNPADAAIILGASGRGGPEAEGLLTHALAEDPHRVILLDEIDKCHPEILHCLFDALDGAKGRDKATGRTVDFSGCVFFATCNAGVEGLRALKEADAQSSAAKARDVLAREASFDKSFLARFSEILLLDELAAVHVAEIACLLIGKQWREQGIEVSYISPEFLARAVLANEEFGHYGVRQLAHCVRRMTDGLMEEARARGVTRAAIGLDAAGGAALVAEPESRSTAAA